MAGGRRLALAPWPAGGQEPAASWCTSWSVGGTDCLGADAGHVRWSNPSGTPPDGVRPALDGAETSTAASKWGTSWAPRQAQLTESAACWTRRRQHGAGGGTEVGTPAAIVRSGRDLILPRRASIPNVEERWRSRRCDDAATANGERRGSRRGYSVMSRCAGARWERRGSQRCTA